MKFRILYQDPHLVAIDKPAGFHVHPPEDARFRIPASTNCLAILRTQLNQYLYPVHRLDRATSGILIFALDPSSASKISELFRNGGIRKRYYCVTRGWVEDQGLIDRSLTAEDPSLPKREARTRFECVGRMELPGPVGKCATARYSLVSVEPETGRMHQIRRHFASLSHPLVGDTVYGDGKHNVFFRQWMGERALLLKAYSLELPHPVTGELLRIHARWDGLWHRLFDAFGICPWSAKPTSHSRMPQEFMSH